MSSLLLFLKSISSHPIQSISCRLLLFYSRRVLQSSSSPFSPSITSPLPRLIYSFLFKTISIFLQIINILFIHSFFLCFCFLLLILTLLLHTICSLSLQIDFSLEINSSPVSHLFHICCSFLFCTVVIGKKICSNIFKVFL